MKKNTRIPIAFFTAKYNIYSLAVAISSLLDNKNKEVNYDLYILSSKIEDEYKKKLREFVNNYVGTKIEFIEIKDIKEISDNELENFYKSKALSYLKSFDKIVLSSSDVLFTSDISKVFDELTSEYHILEIESNNHLFVLNLKKIRENKLLSFSKVSLGKIKKYKSKKDILIYYDKDNKPWNKVDNDLSIKWLKYIINTSFVKEFLKDLPRTINVSNERIVVKQKTSLYRRIANVIPYRARLIVKHPSKLFERRTIKLLQRKMAKKDYSYIIFDDVFPCPLSPFRYEEFMEYILDNRNTYFALTGTSMHALNEFRELKDVIEDFSLNNYYPISKLFDITKDEREKSFEKIKDIKNPLAIFVFERNIINDTYDNLSFLEENNIPFIITLYPGGGLLFNDKKSDDILRRILKSKCFRKVIVTQDNVKNYLLSKKMCSEDDIEFIFGVVTPGITLNNVKKERTYYPVKKTFDICFVAHKYSPKGEDKGYDLFISAAKKLVKDNKNSNFKFHVVGGFTDKDIDVEDIKDLITFYGIKTAKDLDELLIKMDVIISPTRPFVLSKYSFDGFPTASTTDAMLNGAVAIVTDELNLNNNRFVNNEEIIIVKPEVKSIVEKVKYLYDNPKALVSIAKKGRRKAKNIYSIKQQIDRRIKLVNKVAKKEYKK